METQKQLLIYTKLEEKLFFTPGKECGTAQVVTELLNMAGRFNLKGNLWQQYLTWQMMMDENPFSLACEQADPGECTLKLLALNDMETIYTIFHCDLKEEDACLGLLQDYKPTASPRTGSNKHIGKLIADLSASLAQAGDAAQFLEILMAFYRAYGVGEMGLNKSFRVKSVENEQPELLPIRNMERVVLSDLVGYEIQKKKLIANTEAFIKGRPANNVLLFGDSGTGKSTSIKAIVNEYYDKGLRMIEIYKHQMRDLSNIIAQVKNRNYRFIIYMDDLSFEEFEIEYKFLKAVIEGGVETRPENVLIYATSNRRHLIKELWSDRDDVEQGNGMHHSDTMEEKLSLARRFGVTISYSKPSQKEYFHIVEVLAEKEGIKMSSEELRREANKWELSHGGISGRTAQQFVDYLAGLEE